MKHTTLSRFASLAASAALALSLAACGSTSRSTYSAAPSNDTAAFSSQDAGDYEYYSAESAEAGEGSSFSSDDLTSSMLDPSTVESSRKIVYNASVRMETTDYDTTRAALQEAVTAANGYLESTDQGGSKDSGSRYTYYTARIPAENYRSFLTAAGEAGNVTSLNESAQDITAEYVDVEARLKALNDQRDRLNALADKAETTADLLEIESQLSDVQYQLENYTRQLKNMDQQVSYSTVDIRLSEVATLTPTGTTFGERVADAFAGGWHGFVVFLQGFVLAVIYLWPVLLVVGIIVALAVTLTKRRRKNHPKPVKPAAPAKPAEYTPQSTNDEPKPKY